MNRYTILGAALCFIVCSGCQTRPGLKATSPESVPAGAEPLGVEPVAAEAHADPLEAEFRAGRALLKSGNHMAAIKHFAYLRDHATSTEYRDRAVIGLSMALQDSGNTGAALGVLEPLPDTAVTRTEAMMCILAGELYLHRQNFELARIWLGRGLEAEPDSQKSYRATAFFNLGKALLGEDNLEDAYLAFEGAQEIFSFNGDEMNANQCMIILDDIDRALQ